MAKLSLEEWLKIDRTELLTAVKAAVRDCASGLIASHPDICGFALLPGTEYEVNDICVAWTSTPEIKEDTAYYRYSVDEWPHYELDALASITPMLTALNETFADLHRGRKPEGDYAMDRFERAHIRAYQDTLLQAMRELRQEGVFAFPNAEPYLVIWLSDSGSEIMWRSVKELNCPETVSAFLGEFGSGPG